MARAFGPDRNKAAKVRLFKNTDDSTTNNQAENEEQYVKLYEEENIIG